MTEAEAKRVRGELTMVYRIWHQCGLPERDAEKMHLPPGQLCDACLGDIDAAMRRIILGEGNGL